MAADSHTLQCQLAYSMLAYLADLRKTDDSNVDAEALEVASQCLQNSFGVDPTNDAHRERFGVPHSLPAIFTAGLAALQASSSAPSATAAAAPASASTSSADAASTSRWRYSVWMAS